MVCGEVVVVVETMFASVGWYWPIKDKRAWDGASGSNDLQDASFYLAILFRWLDMKRGAQTKNDGTRHCSDLQRKSHIDGNEEANHLKS